MNENQRRVLDMLAEGKISADEAERLLALVDQSPAAEAGGQRDQEGRRPAPKYLRVVVEPNAEGGTNGGGERVNIRVPIALVRAGMKLAALVPPEAATGINEALHRKGVDLDVRNLKANDLEQLIDALRDLEIDVETQEQKVRVYVE